MRQTLQKYVDEGPSEDQLKAAKQNITGGFPLRIASNSKIVEYLAVIGFYDLPLDYLDTFVGKVEAVTAEHVSDNECQLMAAFNGGGCLDAMECSRVVDEAQTTGSQTCDCHTDGGVFEADGGACADVVTGFCSGGVCGEPGSDASVRLIAAGGPEALSTFPSLTINCAS